MEQNTTSVENILEKQSKPALEVEDVEEKVWKNPSQEEVQGNSSQEGVKVVKYEEEVQVTSSQGGGSG